MDGDDWEKAGEDSVQPDPVKRCGGPEEVAVSIAVLLSGEAGFVDGAVITIDGGAFVQVSRLVVPSDREPRFFPPTRFRAD